MKSKSEKELNLVFSNIASVVCEEFGESLSAVLGKTRTLELVKPRSVISHLCRNKAKMSFSFIADKFGMKSHASIMHLTNNTYTQHASESMMFRNSVARIEVRIADVLKEIHEEDTMDLLIEDLKSKLNKMRELVTSVEETLVLYTSKDIVNTESK
jgi:hypothetical protein